MSAFNPNPSPPHRALTHLQMLNLIIAIMAGIITVAGGVYSLKANFFTPKTGTLEGTVQDRNIAKPLWQVPIEISGASGSVVASVETDKQGLYLVEDLPEGEYKVRVTAPLHEEAAKTVRIMRQATTRIDFDLIPEKEPLPAAFVETAPIATLASAYPPAAQGAAQSQVPTSNAYAAPSQGSVASAYDRPALGTYHRHPPFQRPPPPGTGPVTGDPPASSKNSALTQVVGELIQGLAASKTEEASSTG
ncbi:MAG: MSCRAMM family protein [Candidatus Omnitrophota bacterium]